MAGFSQLDIILRSNDYVSHSTTKPTWDLRECKRKCAFRMGLKSCWSCPLRNTVECEVESSVEGKGNA